MQTFVSLVKWSRTQVKPEGRSAIILVTIMRGSRFSCDEGSASLPSERCDMADDGRRAPSAGGYDIWRVDPRIDGPRCANGLPGVKGVHAVDASGFHPLLLAIGSERYTPYAKPNRPQELLTQACAILGQGQLSLAKYLWITDHASDPNLDIEDVQGFLMHSLRRCDWRRDLHFHTRTTMDTLDYSGDSLNQGSKLVIAAAGLQFAIWWMLLRRSPPTRGLEESSVAIPGVLAVESQRCSGGADQRRLWETCDRLGKDHPLNRFAMVVMG